MYIKCCILFVFLFTHLWGLEFAYNIKLESSDQNDNKKGYIVSS